MAAAAARSRSSSPSLLLPLAFLLTICILPTTSQDEDNYYQRLGKLGTDYSLRRGTPYLRCATWDMNRNTMDQQCYAEGSEFNNKKRACNGLFRVKKEVLAAGIEERRNIPLEPEEYDPITGGCWSVQEESEINRCKEDECIATVTENSADPRYGIAFCCCTSHMCNQNVTIQFRKRGRFNNTWADEEEEEEEEVAAATSSEYIVLCTILQVLWIFLLVALVTVVIFVCIVLACSRGARNILRLKLKNCCSRRKRAEDEPLVQNIMDSITQGEIIADGRMGIVRKGDYTDPETGEVRAVAVKTVRDANSFLAEEAAYRMCNNQHAQLVHYYGYRCEPETRLFVVVVAHYELGSLEEYLKNETFTPLSTLSFLCSFMDGLQFLHSPATLPLRRKNPIVHRDLKSRNVLVKSDRTAAISDFGTAMICESSKPATGRQYQVGTHRYMAPELLIGLANLNLEGLKAIDIYAAALVFWEVLNRTVVDDEDEELPAQPPYSTEIEEATKMDEASSKETNPYGDFHARPIEVYLKDIVHKDNKRPHMREKLKENPITKELFYTVLDMWHIEVDGRISAACAHSRLSRRLEETREEERNTQNM